MYRYKQAQTTGICSQPFGCVQKLATRHGWKDMISTGRMPDQDDGTLYLFTGGDMGTQWVTPDKPDPTLIKEIHRDHTGYVGYQFVDEETQDWKPFGAVPNRSTQHYFPEMSPYFDDQQAAFTINALQKGGKPFTSAPHWFKGLQYSRRVKQNVQRLNACYVDLDYYKLGIDFGQAVGALLSAAERDLIPNPSIMLRSGKGLWAFWLLQEHRKKDMEGVSNQGVKARKRNTDHWVAIQRRLHDLFADTGSDRAVTTDITRCTRIPGTVGKNKKRVGSIILVPEEGESTDRFIYTLPEMGEFLGVEHPYLKSRKHESVTRDLDKIRSSNQKCWATRWANCHSDFETLWACRETFKQGTRNYAVRLYTLILKGIGQTKQESWFSLQTLVKEGLDPGSHPYEKRDSERALEEAWAKPKKIDGDDYDPNYWQTVPGYHTIAENLDITAAEKSQGLAYWPCARRYEKDLPEIDHTGLTYDKLPTRKLKQERRRGWLQEIYDDLQKKQGTGGWMSLRQWQDHLSDLYGIVPSTKTLSKDFEEMGIDNPDSKKKSKAKKKAMTSPDDGLNQTEMF